MSDDITPWQLLTDEFVYDFIVDSSDNDGRRQAWSRLVLADMVVSRAIAPSAYNQGEWRIIEDSLAALVAQGFISIESGPERSVYSDEPQLMIQVSNWGKVRRKRGNIPSSVRQMIYDRDGNQCVKCDSGVCLSLDHIVPWSKGGSDDESNLQTMCQSCNSSKSNRVAANV